MKKSQVHVGRKHATRLVEAPERVAAQTGEAVASLGPSIRKRRKEAGLTLQEVAHRAELSISYLSQVERNPGNLRTASEGYVHGG
jgi:hypothetical protein